MAKTKATVRRLPSLVPAPGQRIGNKNIMNRRNAMFKLKNLLPQPKHIEVKKKWAGFKENERKKKVSLFLW